MRRFLPFGSRDNNEERSASRGQQISFNWQDVCFIHSICGEETEDGVVVLTDGTLRSYIKCRGINALLYDHADEEALARSFSDLANSCESDIQIIIKARNLPVDEYLSRYQTLINTDDPYLRWLADYTDLWFRRKQTVEFVPQRDFYVIVSYRPPDCDNQHVGKVWSGRRSIQVHEECLESLNRLTIIAFEQLRQANLRPLILTRAQVRNLIYADLNPSLAQREPEAPPSRPGISEASVLSQSAMKVAADHLWLDKRYISTQYLQQAPHETWLGWLVNLLTLSVEYTVSIFIHTCDQDKVRDDLKKKFHLGAIASAQLPMHDLEGAETTMTAASAFREFLRSSNKAFDVSMYITTAADSEQRLAQKNDEIRRVFKNRGAILDRGTLLQLEAWQATLPVGVDKLAVAHRVMSPIVGTCWPFFTAACGTPDGVPFGFALASHEPVLLNPFFRGNGKDANNMFVVGTTGAGKSFAVSMLILRLLPLGTRFVLLDKTVDKQGAYRFITDLIGSEHCHYVDLGPSSHYVLNPFDLGADETPGEPSPEKISMLLGLLDLMLAKEKRDELEVEEKSLLDDLIRSVYRAAHARGRVPTISDLAWVTAQAATQESDPLQRRRLQRFARGLALYTNKGAFGGMLDGQTNIDLEKLFIVFDTREVNDPRLERIAVFITAEFIRRRAAEYKQRGIRFAAIIDEASTLMRFKAGARLLDDLSRRGRQYGMMLVSITQQLKDFFGQAEHADSVVKNSHMKLILRQDPSDLRLLKDTLRLTDAEIRAVENFSRGEEQRRDSQMLLIAGSAHGTIRLVPSPLDYWICTSEPIKDIPLRKAQIAEIQRLNPGISYTNAARRAVFQLGLQCDI